MPVVLTDRDYETLKRHLQEAQQECSNLKRRIAGQRKNHGGARVGKPGVRFYNDSGETIPAYGIMRIKPGGTDGFLNVDKPNTTFSGLYLVNGPDDVAYQSWSRGSFLLSDTVGMFDRMALYNTADTPATGEHWGPVSNSWLLTKNSSGFYILGGADGTKVSVIQVATQHKLFRGITNAQINKGATNGVVSRYLDGTNTDSGIDDTVTNDWASVGSGKLVMYAQLGSIFYITSTEKTAQPLMSDIRVKTGDTHIEAEELDVFVDSVDAPAWEDKIENIDECPP